MARAARETSLKPKLGYQPLYAKVRDTLVERLVDGTWVPGQALPNEFELAAEIGVSQGTVRKALDALAAESLIVRHQGRGTFVAEHDEARILFRFFRLVPDEGSRAFPESRVIDVSRGRADKAEAAALAIARQAPVVRIRRVRSLSGKPAVCESITLPGNLFEGIEDEEVPNNLYGAFARRFRVTVARADEKLKAVALDEEDAATLSVAAGTPALLVDRLAYGLDGTIVEWRRSHCLTTHLHYSAALR